MSFYHTNLNTKLGDIVDICDIQNSDFNPNTILNAFVRPDIAANGDLTFSVIENMNLRQVQII